MSTMRGLLSALLALLAVNAHALSYTFQAAYMDGTAGAVQTIASGSLNSTGFTHAVLCLKHEGLPSTYVVTDSRSGATSFAAVALEDHTSTDLSSLCFWAKLASPGSGQTFTVDLASGAGTRPFVTLSVYFVLSSTAELAVNASAHAEGSSTAFDGGSLATTGVSVVSFMIVGEYASGVSHTATGWTEDFDGAGGSGPNYTACYSRGPETTSPIDPAGTVSSSSDWTVSALSLAEFAGGGGGLFVNPISGRGGAAAQPLAQ